MEARRFSVIRILVWKIIRAMIFSILWAGIVFIAAFPSFLKEGRCFLAKEFTYQDTGFYLLITVGVFILDFIIHFSLNKKNAYPVVHLRTLVQRIAVCTKYNRLKQMM
jgi:hypothetical protein